MTQFLAPLMKDGYKVFHKFAYNPKVTHVYSNFTNRFSKYSNVPNNSKVLFVGIQYFIKSVLIDAWNTTFFNVEKDAAVGEYKRVVDAYLGKDIDVSHLEALHDLGYLPIRVKSVEEGTMVPYNVPSLTIVNTVEGFGWLTNMLETVMSSEIWPICTSATTAFAYRQRFEKETLIPKEGIPFMGHDFSYRGMMGTQAAAMSGFGHLTSFVGSDTIPAGLFAEKYYNASIDKELVIASVDATEHSTSTSYISVVAKELEDTGLYDGKTMEELWKL
jgi:nicotinamide phosphoribosyltransferase